MMTEVRPESWNAFSPMVVTVSGMVISLRKPQLLNSPDAMVVMPSPKVALLSAMQPPNGSLAFFSVEGMWMLVIGALANA